MITIRCKVLAKESDVLGYSTMVVKDLDNFGGFGHSYCMVTILPNWQGLIPEIGDDGYLSYNEVIAGKDKWYCPETGQMIPYNYTNIYFVKFVKEKDNSKKDIIL